MSEYRVTDPTLESAVDADLYDLATPDQLELIHTNPHAWRAALAARLWVVNAVKTNAARLQTNTAIHDKDGIIAGFANVARDCADIFGLKAAIQARITYARQLSEEMARDATAHEAEDMRRLLAYATTIIPTSQVVFWDRVNAFCERHRNGAPFVHRERSP